MPKGQTKTHHRRSERDTEENSQSRNAVVIAVVSDTHINSTLGMTPPEGVVLDDGGRYAPSKAQSWLWGCWENYWLQVAAVRKQHHARLYIVVNGDACEGTSHHNTTQVVSAHPEPQAYLMDRVFGVPLALKPHRKWIVKGTEAHVGPSGATEEAFARSIGAEKDSDTDRWSWWRLRLEVHGVRLDFAHHGRIGTRPWTRMSGVAALAAEIFYEHSANGHPYPHLAVRSHRHVYGDSFTAHPTRVIQTAAFQLKTAFAHRVACESIADIGGLIITVQPDGTFEVTPKLFKPELPPMWREP